MRIYISGKTTGLNHADVLKNFNNAQNLLESLGFEVVNPLNNGLYQAHTWRQHIVRNVELLLPCEAIYMLENWIDSIGAGIEYDIAIRTSKNVWFETNFVRNQKNVLKIQNAIHEVTGMKFNEYTTKGRKRDAVFARMIFTHHCHANSIDMMQYIFRNRTMIYHYLKKYDDEKRYNPNFRILAQRVDDILKQTSVLL